MTVPLMLDHSIMRQFRPHQYKENRSDAPASSSDAPAKPHHYSKSDISCKQWTNLHTLAVTIGIDVNCRIDKASFEFSKLQNNVWDRREISLATKLKVYWAVVLTTLMYASKTGTVYRRHTRQIKHFSHDLPLKLLRIQ